MVELNKVFLDEEDPDERPRSLLREIISFAGYVVFVVLFTYIIVTYVGQRTEVVGSSMYPTLHDGDNLLVDKISYRFTDIERFDIIVFEYQHEENVYYIKRIIGLPGETVQITDGNIYINGELLEEDYGYEVMESAGLAAEPVTLGENEYFVLGDNRNDSTDSRDPRVGNITRDIIVGKAFVRIYPFDAIGFLKHQRGKYDGINTADQRTDGALQDRAAAGIAEHMAG